MRRIKGRPADETGRLAKEIRCYDFLDAISVEYERIDHEPVFTMDGLEERRKELGAMICKNLFLCNRQKTNFYLLMIPAFKNFRTADVSKQLGISRLSFADEIYMEEFLDITPGSVSVLGLMNDKENRVQLVIDKEVLSEEYIGCHPCINTTSMRFKTEDFLEKVIPALKHEPVYVE